MKLLLIFAFLTVPFVADAYAQEIIIVNETTPCFLNATAGIDMWSNCGADEDFVSFALLPFNWITGGYFSMILASVLILAVYIKYNKVIFAVGIGVVLIPSVYQFFPVDWWGFIIIVVALGVSVGIIWMIRENVR